ncbi:polysaccharide biosynthesis/export family protein [Myxococcaceae bacterium GXIMD 01537]
MMPSRSSRSLLSLAALGAVLLSTACAPVGRFVWVDEYPAKPSPQETGYLIAPGDALAIKVWNQESLTSRVRVREDGKVSLFFLHDVQAVGLTPQALAEQLQVKLKDYLSNPVVTVALEEARLLSIAVLGEVVRGGQMQLPSGAGVLQALAGAGGFTEYARKQHIYVLRQEGGTPVPTRIRFTWEHLIHAEGQAPTFRLRTGDVVVVE